MRHGKFKSSEDRKKKNVIHEVPCKDCVYIGEASRTLLEKCLSEHKNAVKKHNTNNGIAAHTWNNQHHVDWRPLRQKEWEKTTGKEEYWNPCTSINSSKPPTLTVVWPSISGYCCLIIPHDLDNIHYLFPPLIWFMSFLILFLYFPSISDSIWHNISVLLL